MIYLDTNVLVRYFIKDDPTLFLKAKKLLENENDLFVPDVVFVELEFVLDKVYKVSREEISQAFNLLVTNKFITSSEAPPAYILFAKKPMLSMADCFLAIYSQHGKLATFDKKLLSNSGSESYW